MQNLREQANLITDPSTIKQIRTLLINSINNLDHHNLTQINLYQKAMNLMAELFSLQFHVNNQQFLDSLLKSSSVRLDQILKNSENIA